MEAIAGGYFDTLGLDPLDGLPLPATARRLDLARDLDPARAPDA
jgi:hypothetical protein